MLCWPADNLVTVSVATPLAFNTDVPSGTAPSENVTVPVGIVVTPAGPCTVAVNVTPASATEGFTLDASVVVVGCSMCSASTAEVAGALFGSPLYTAVIWATPGASVAVESVAAPEAVSVAIPIWAVPSMKVTVPVGTMAAPFDTTAVNVTAEPTAAGFALAVKLICVGCTSSTCPDRLIVAGLFAVFDTSEIEPVTRVPITVGANSTPSTQV